MAESFFGSLKVELVHGVGFTTREATLREGVGNPVFGRAAVERAAGPGAMLAQVDGLVRARSETSL